MALRSVWQPARADKFFCPQIVLAFFANSPNDAKS